MRFKEAIPLYYPFRDTSANEENCCTVTKAETCGAAGVMTYTCSCGKSYTEVIPATGNHNWIEQFKTVHHDAQTHIVHHDAVTHIVHHDELSHQEWVVDKGAWDETVHDCYKCSVCGATKP